MTLRRVYVRWSIVTLAVGLLSLRLVADPAASSATKIVTIAGAEALAVGFEQLASFTYTLPATPTDAKPEIPLAIRSLDQKRVAITGYMMPMHVENGLAKQAILMRSLMTCCYGVAPNFNEYVIVTMRGDGIRPLMDTPVTFVGTLKIGETYEENYFVGIYQLDGEQVIESAAL
jgi:hypothetical protein